MAWLPAPVRALILDGVYLAIMLAAAPWLIWRSLRTGRYREGWPAKFLGRSPLRTSAAPCLWMHAVSVGEVNLLAPLIAQWSRRRPDWELVISTTTHTGYALARKKYPDRTVFYCPLDFSWATRRAVARVRPDLVVLAELELWPNLIAAVKASGAKAAVVNGRLSDRSFRGYRRIRWLLAPTLERLDLVTAQTDEYAQRFIALGAPRERVLAIGSVKFDGATIDRANPATAALARAWGIAPSDIVFLAGSTQEPEESLALATFRELSAQHPRLRLILAPRHPERFSAVAAMLRESGVAWQLRSQLEPAGADTAASADSAGSPPSVARVLLVDRMGELGAWWGTAHVGFVGGSLGSRGGQNMIEPAAYGVAVCFGPRTQNFRDVVAALLAANAAVVVSDGPSLTEFVRGSLEEPELALELGRRAQQIALANQGAARRTIDALESLVGDPPQSCRSTTGAVRKCDAA